MSALLAVHDLRVAVTAPDGGVRDVVRGVSFDLRRGSLTAIVGESGSGKTLTLRAVLGIADALPGVTGGRALVDEGRGPIDVLARRGKRRALPGLRPGWAGYVFQHPRESLDPMVPVGAQVEASVRAGTPGRDRAAVREAALGWLEAVALPDPRGVASLLPGELSGGMAQRVAIAVALATEPALLVADEPTTGLDWSVRRDIVDLLLRLHRERSQTLVLVTHDMAVVRHLAPRVLVLRDGVVVQDAPAGALFDPAEPRHPYAAELLDRVEALEAGRPPPPPVVGPAGAGPAACPYAPRCALLAARPELAARCLTSAPPLRPTGAHRIACHGIAP